MSTSSLFTAIIIASALGTALPLHAQGNGKTAKKDKTTEAKAAQSVTSEPLGQLALGQTPAEVVKLLGKAESKGKRQMQEATGTSVQDWNYPAKGLTVTMEFVGKKETVCIIRATGACSLATARGIRIGSTEAAVKKAYAKERSQDDSKDGESFVAGSLYDGVIFTFKEGKVTDIFIGAAAE